MSDTEMPDADWGPESEWTDTPDSDPTDTSDTDWDDTLQTMLGSRYVARLPAISQTQISQSKFNQDCTICITAFDSKESSGDVVQTWCGHFYHRHCVNNWLSEDEADNTTCPTCRQTLFERPEEEAEYESEDEWEWPRGDDCTFQWLSDLVHLENIRTDLELYSELYRNEVLPNAPDPEASKLNPQEELAMLRDILRREEFGDGRPTRRFQDSDAEYLEVLRLAVLSSGESPESWLLRYAFPEYDAA